MARFYFVENSGACFINGVFYDAPFTIDTNEPIAISKFFDDCHLDGFIDIKNKKAYGVTLICWQNENYEVLLDKPEILRYTTPTPTMQKSTQYLDDIILATIYYDGSNNLMLECNNHIANFPLPPIQNFDILFSETGVGLLIVITGSIEDKEYLLVILYDGDVKKCVEVTAQNITFSNDGFTTIDNIQDMLGRTKYTTYSFSGKNIQKSTKFTYKYECKNLIPYLFLEAIRCRDEIYHTYLSKDMDAPLNCFLEYFGDFSEIECPKYAEHKKISDLNEVAIYSKTKGIITPRFYTFEIQDGVITNIVS